MKWWPSCVLQNFPCSISFFKGQLKIGPITLCLFVHFQAISDWPLHTSHCMTAPASWNSKHFTDFLGLFLNCLQIILLSLVHTGNSSSLPFDLATTQVRDRLSNKFLECVNQKKTKYKTVSCVYLGSQGLQSRNIALGGNPSAEGKSLRF